MLASSTPTGVVPSWRRPVFAVFHRVVGAFDDAAVWASHDVDSVAHGGSDDVVPEIRLRRRLDRAWRWIAAFVIAFFVVGIALIWWGAPRLLGHGRVVDVTLAVVAGVVVHGLFILIVHDATHGNVLGGRRDRWLGNIALGMLLLPFLAESYQHTHHVHHRAVNGPGDNNWTKGRDALFRRGRLLYVLYELVPVVNNVDRLADRVPRDPGQVLVAWLAAAVVVVVAHPPFSWWLAVIFFLNVVNAARLWIEHYGVYRGRTANCYAAPFSFGIGNHTLHHLRPRIPALVLAVGLWLRRKDVTIWSSLPRVLFHPRWRHFRLQQPDGDSA